MRRRIGFLLLEDYALMSCAAAVEPLRAANLLAGQALYDLVFLSARGGPALASVGGGFETVALAQARGPLEAVFVVAGGNPLAGPPPQAVLRFLRGLDRRGVALGGISGGAVVLAQAGLMQGRRFTVHWQHFDALRELSPDYLMERRLFVIDRDRFTCAGGSAPLDMMHALITAHHGAGLAQAVADWFIHTQIRAADAPQKSGLGGRDVRNPALQAVLDLMESHIADPLSVAQLAALSGLSPRHFQRVFAAEMGVSLIQFYRDLRLDTARALLGQTGLSVLEVALATGFANGAHFARVFRERFGTRPSDLRASRRVAGGGAGSGAGRISG